MRKLPYPPDGGLKKQVRNFDECYSAFECIKNSFKVFKDPDDNMKYLCIPNPDDNEKYKCKKTEFDRRSWL